MFVDINNKNKIMKLNLNTKMKLNVSLFFCLILILSCKQQSFPDEKIEYQSKDNLLLNEKQATKTNRVNLKIIKTAKTKYKVKDVKKATKRIKLLASNYDGFISDLRFQNNLYSIKNNFTIKIPKDNFDVFLDSIHKYVEFINFESVSTRDVTESYFDAESRLNTKKEVKKRYEEILRKRAKTVDDVLKTEEKIRVIQEEIDATKGRLIYLNNRISFSTIEIELYQDVEFKELPDSNKINFFTKVKEGFVNGSNIILTIFLGIVNIWPLLILGFVLFIIFKKRKN